MAFLMVLTYHKLGSNGVSTTQNIIITHLWWSMDWFRDNWHRMPWLNSFYTTIKTSKTGEKWNAGIGFCRCSSESRTISPDSGLSSALTEEVVRLFTSNTLRNSPSIDSTHPGTSRAGTYWLFGTELLIKGSPASLMAQGRKSYSWPKSLGQLDQGITLDSVSQEPATYNHRNKTPSCKYQRRSNTWAIWEPRLHWFT